MESLLHADVVRSGRTINVTTVLAEKGPELLIRQLNSAQNF